MIIQDPYYGRKEVSNSDLVELKKYFLPSNLVLDLEQAYRFGNLVDAMITEAHKCDHMRKQVEDVQFTDQEWNTAYNMLKAFRKDPFCMETLRASTGQKVFTMPRHDMEFEGIDFSLAMRCKYDLFMDAAGYGGDIKSTVATSQSQFVDAFQHFDYDQSRALYMDLSGAKRDVVIGISKKEPHKIFKIFITRDSEIYKSGKAKYQELAFRWWTLFEELRMEVAA